ncbi:tetratricopeptide repeat protein [Asanoa sp. NPDC049518]|uniref:tetratricopeptide repeat protein n=1 Tax=unclassified Asanoa TaxID=2685164 RepID=UPI003438B77A
MTAPERDSGVRAAGRNAAAVATNQGIVQTGAGAKAIHNSVALGVPAQITVPEGGILGMPKPGVRDFVGRHEQLDALDGLVRAGAGVVAQAVHGLGGVGKSELALQYVARYRHRYGVVWWIVAEDADKIRAGLADLAFRLHTELQIVATQDEAANWTLAWLQAHDGWLLVLDNVEDRLLAEPLLGQLRRGHVLITTRRDVGWDDITDGCLRLDVLAPPAAVDLLLRLSGEADAATAERLAAELGYLPLALRQAGAYLRQTRTGIERYLRRLRSDPATVLDLVAAGDDAQQAVARVWAVTTKTIGQQNPLAMRVLRVLSCLAPDDLPRDVLHPLADVDDVDQALGMLASYNMITLTHGTVAVHRLVQSVTATQLKQGSAVEFDGILLTAIELLRAALPSESPETDVAGWPRWAALTPHVTALVTACPDTVGGGHVALLLDSMVGFDIVQGRFQQALRLERRALTIAEASLGDDDLQTAAIIGNLAGILKYLGREAESEPLQRRAMAISEAALGPDHPTIAIGLNNLALTLRHLGRTHETEPLHRRAVSIAEASLGPEHPITARYLHNFGYSLLVLDRADEAEPLHRRALAITENAFAPDHPLLATSLDNLALTLNALARSDEAEPLQRRALAITEAAFGPDHPTMVVRLGNLASTLLQLGRADRAEPLEWRALSIAEATLGADHPNTAIAQRLLARTLETLGRGDEVVQLRLRAEAINQAVSAKPQTR